MTCLTGPTCFHCDNRTLFCHGLDEVHAMGCDNSECPNWAGNAEETEVGCISCRDIVRFEKRTNSVPRQPYGYGDGVQGIQNELTHYSKAELEE